jgi:hypothetical protein
MVHGNKNHSLFDFLSICYLRKMEDSTLGRFELNSKSEQPFLCLKFAIFVTSLYQNFLFTASRLIIVTLKTVGKVFHYSKNDKSHHIHSYMEHILYIYVLHMYFSSV